MKSSHIQIVSEDFRTAYRSDLMQSFALFAVVSNISTMCRFGIISVTRSFWKFVSNCKSEVVLGKKNWRRQGTKWASIT
jgi:hypothetical protein